MERMEGKVAGVWKKCESSQKMGTKKKVNSIAWMKASEKNINKTSIQKTMEGKVFLNSQIERDADNERGMSFGKENKAQMHKSSGICK